MSNKINVLFLGGAKRVSLAELFIKAGEKHGKNISIFSYELDPFVPIASIGKVVIGLKWHDANIINHLSEIVKEHHIHIILPFVDGATLIAARLKEMLKNIFIPVSSEATCTIMFDKVTSNQWFQKHQIPVPGNDGKYPLIAKPRKGSASKGLVIISNKEDLNNFQLNFDEKDFLIQNYLTADEYTVDAYVSKEGKVLSAIPRKRIEVTSGEATKSVTVKDQEIIDLSKHILSLADFQGPITLQFLREKKTNNLYMMEINPRFGGGVTTSIRAGADSTQMLLSEYLQKPLKVIDDWEENLIMTRAFREFFYHANNH